MTISLELAISAIRLGRKEEGRQLLNLLIQQNPNDDQAWLWMSSVVTTDEQRARCLYHVLAINPESELARKGLQILGINVSDSRPVRVPRDSQPIRIPNPTSVSGASQTQARPMAVSSAERRPFLINPEVITKELPFTPLRSPNVPEIQASPSILAIDVEAVLDDSAVVVSDSRPYLPQNGAGPSSEATNAAPIAASVAGPVKSSQPGTGQESLFSSANHSPDQKTLLSAKPDSRSAETQKMESKLPELPGRQVQAVSKPVLTNNAIQQKSESVQANEQNDPAKTPAEPDSDGAPTDRSPDEQTAPAPSKPVPVVASEVEAPLVNQQEAADELPPSFDSDPAGTGPANPAVQPTETGTLNPNPSQPFPANGSPMVPNETRPSQPVPVTYPPMNNGMVHNNQGGYYPMQMPTSHANETMGMPPTQYGQPQPMPQQMMPGPHANITQGMPLGYQLDPRPPSEPVPVIHSNSTLGMIPYGASPFQQAPQGMAFHTNSTMMMPVLTEAEARARLMTGQAIPTTNAAAMALQNGVPQSNMVNSQMHPGLSDQTHEEDDEGDGEEINILAVIIFGTLSVTALGGLGMLILLVFTAPAA